MSITAGNKLYPGKKAGVKGWKRLEKAGKGWKMLDGHADPAYFARVKIVMTGLG